MHIGFIGAGKMAEALIAGLIKAGIESPGCISAGDISPERCRYMVDRYGITCAAANDAIITDSDVLVLAVKPQQLEATMAAFEPRPGLRHLVVSIAAGKSLAWLSERLPATRLVRVMPNIACQVGEGMSVFTRGPGATVADGATVTRLLQACGDVCEMPEILFDAVTALSGSGPAFWAYLLDRMVDGAVAEGMTRADAMRLARQTMRGTARLLDGDHMAPQQLIEAVTSARGTTAAGRAIMENSDVGAILHATIHAAAARSRELSRT